MKFEKHPFLAHLYELDCDYRVMLYSDTSNKNIYSHSHNFFEMFLLISGRIVYNTVGTSFYLKPGDFLFINRHQEHFPEMLDFSIPYERMALQVSPQVLKELSMDGVDLSECFTTDTFRVYHYPHPIRSRLSSLLDQLTFLYNSEDIYGKRILAWAAAALPNSLWKSTNTTTTLTSSHSAGTTRRWALWPWWTNILRTTWTSRSPWPSCLNIFI